MGTVTKMADKQGDAVQAPPSSIEAEQYVIGAVMVGSAQGRDVMAAVDGYELQSKFFNYRHRLIWGVMVELHRAGQPLTIDVVGMQVKRDPRCAGESITELAEWAERAFESTASDAHAKYYATEIRHHAARRDAITIAAEIGRKVLEEKRPLADYLPDLATSLLSVDMGKRPLTLSEATTEAVTYIEDLSLGRRTLGVSTGIASLDRMIGGWVDGDLNIVAGRTSMGKSSLCLTVTLNAARAGDQVGYFTLEMPEQTLISRSIAQIADLKASKMKNGWLNASELARLPAAGEEFSRLPIKIVERETSWPAVEVAIHRMVQDGAKLIVIDPIGYLRLPDFRGKRWEEISVITKRAKTLALRLSVPIVCAHQINREALNAKDKRPTIANLREGGSFEEDADLIMMLHRPGYYDAKEPADLCEAIVGKQRNGPTGTVEITWLPDTMSFVDRAQPELGFDD